MSAKNCPETPRQQMINMMYIILTAMLALNVAAEVLEAFRLVDSSLLQTLNAIDMQNDRIYASFGQAYQENPTKVKEWKDKADEVVLESKAMSDYILKMKDELVRYSGCKTIEEGEPLSDKEYYHKTIDGKTLEIGKADDLNGTAEFMITQKRGLELKTKIEEYRTFLVSLLEPGNDNLKKNILEELNTNKSKGNLKEGTEGKAWESEHFEDKPLIAVLTLLSKIQIDIKNSEANLLKHLYSQIDAGSFMFNRLEARVIPNSNVVLEGEPYEAKIFLSAEDSTQQPEIFVKGQKLRVEKGQAIYTANTTKPGVFQFDGVINYKTPGGGVTPYCFKQEYQVTRPSVTMSATKMNVFYKGLENPFEVSGGSIPSEDLEIEMTNGQVIKRDNSYVVKPKELDAMGSKTKVNVYATINGERRLIGTSDWRVKRVPDPVAQIAGKSGGNIRKEELKVQQGVLAVLEEFDFDFKYKVTQFTLETAGSGGFTKRYPAKGNRFTPDQQKALRKVSINSWIYISDIKAVGDDGTTRDLDPISFKVK